MTRGDIAFRVATALCTAALALAPLAGSARADTPGLPDGRGYEMVSPVLNADGDVYEPTLPGFNGGGGNGYNTELPFQAAEGGEAVAYVGDPSAQGGTGSEGKGGGNEYLATRESGGGWVSASIEPAAGSLSEEAVYEAFSSNLSIGVLNWDGPEALGSGGVGGLYHVLYARSGAGDASVFQPLFSNTPPHRSAEEFRVSFAGGSGDFSHLLFSANDALTPLAEEAPPSGEEDDLYESVDGTPRLVDVSGNGKADPNATFGSPPAEAGGAPDLSHVISADGSRIFWTDLNTDDLYVRENGQTTVQVDAALGGGGRFQTASASGSKVFFTKLGHLYEYDLTSAATNDLTPAGEVQSVLGASEDGNYLYFVAHEDLYLLEPGETAHLITALAEANPTAQVTPDGGHLLFADGSKLELYDAQSQTLTCVVCEGTAILQPSHSDTRVPRWISEDGDHVFFDSPDALVPQDTNGRLDVYEWESDGLHLLSSGTSTDNSYFVDASSSGEDVFMVTRSQLAAQDQNESLDLYDVRVGAPGPGPVGPSCTGSGCQGSPSAPLLLPTPASLSFEGLGNLIPSAPTPTPTVVKVVKHVKPKPARRPKHKAKHRHVKHGAHRHQGRKG